MKPEIPLQDGDEQDAFTGWRRVIACFDNTTGLVKRQQRKYWKRVRKHWKQLLRNEKL